MLKHNLLLTLRTFRRFKGSFFINLIGLSTGQACTILIFLWVNDELHVDQFHGKQLYQVMENQQYADELMTTTSTPGLLSDALREEIPEVRYAATTTWIGDYTLSIQEHNVKAEGYHVGRQYFNIFSYPLIEGSADQVLREKKEHSDFSVIGKKAF